MRCAPSPITSPSSPAVGVCMRVYVRARTCVRVQLLMAADTVAYNASRERDPEEQSIRGV